MDVLRITRWGGYPELSGWVQHNHKEGKLQVKKICQQKQRLEGCALKM